jgi:hypothetical protein
VEEAGGAAGAVLDAISVDRLTVLGPGPGVERRGTEHTTTTARRHTHPPQQNITGARLHTLCGPRPSQHALALSADALKLLPVAPAAAGRATPQVPFWRLQGCSAFQNKDPASQIAFMRRRAPSWSPAVLTTATTAHVGWAARDVWSLCCQKFLCCCVSARGCLHADLSSTDNSTFSVLQRLDM